MKQGDRSAYALEKRYIPVRQKHPFREDHHQPEEAHPSKTGDGAERPGWQSLWLYGAVSNEIGV